MPINSVLMKNSSNKTPKYIEIADNIRRDIANGSMQPGDRLPSFAEMRAEFGIGQGTLERVHRILEEDNLIVREPNRGIFVASPGRRLSGMVGICCRNDRGHNLSYENQLLEGVQDVVAQNGFELLLLNSEFDKSWEKVDGILHFYHPHLKAILQQVPSGTPVVSLLTPREGYNCVLASDRDGAQLATLHLLELGHRKIAMMGSREQSFQERRYAGYAQALEEVGIEPQETWSRPIMSYNPQTRYRGSAYETMRHWLQTDWQELGFTAIVALNDEMVIGIAQACSEAGLSIPDDLSVVGFDGAEASEWFLPRLTTIQVPFGEIGRRGAELLFEHIRNPQAPPTEINVPVTLRIGDTTATCTQNLQAV
jgi:DNA-binding LacI/PurR family transcriptional regulator